MIWLYCISLGTFLYSWTDGHGPLSLLLLVVSTAATLAYYSEE